MKAFFVSLWRTLFGSDEVRKPQAGEGIFTADETGKVELTYAQDIATETGEKLIPAFAPLDGILFEPASSEPIEMHMTKKEDVDLVEARQFLKNLDLQPPANEEILSDPAPSVWKSCENEMETHKLGLEEFMQRCGLDDKVFEPSDSTLKSAHSRLDSTTEKVGPV